MPGHFTIQRKMKIEDKAKKVLADYNVDKVYAVDGQIFINENRAVLHANSAGKAGKPLKVVEFKSEESVVHSPQSTDGSQKPDFEARAEAVSNAATIEEVKALLEGESSKTVQKAGAARIAQLEVENHGDAASGESTDDSPQTEDASDNKETNTDK